MLLSGIPVRAHPINGYHPVISNTPLLTYMGASGKLDTENNEARRVHVPQRNRDKTKFRKVISEYVGKLFSFLES